MNHGLKVNNKTLEITLPDGIDIEKVVVNGKEFVLSSAELEVIRCKDCKHSADYYHEGDCYCLNPKWGLMYFGGSWKFYCGGAELRGGEK